MRKSDKLKNFKKVNLLTEQRYLQSKAISGPEIDIDGITDSLVATTLHGGDDNTIYLRAKESLANSNDQVKGEFYNMLADKMEANNLTNQAQQYRSIAQQFKSELDAPHDELEEGIFGNMFGNKNKKNDLINKAMSEIDNYNFGRVFIQPANGQPIDADILKQRIDDAIEYMPTVANLLPELFELKGNGYYTSAIIDINGEMVNGVVPGSFIRLLSDNNKLNDEYAKEKVKNIILNKHN